MNFYNYFYNFSLKLRYFDFSIFINNLQFEMQRECEATASEGLENMASIEWLFSYPTVP